MVPKLPKDRTFGIFVLEPLAIVHLDQCLEHEPIASGDLYVIKRYSALEKVLVVQSTIMLLKD